MNIRLKNTLKNFRFVGVYLQTVDIIPVEHLGMSLNHFQRGHPQIRLNPFSSMFDILFSKWRYTEIGKDLSNILKTCLKKIKIVKYYE